MHLLATCLEFRVAPGEHLVQISTSLRSFQWPIPNSVNTNQLEKMKIECNRRREYRNRLFSVGLIIVLGNSGP